METCGYFDSNIIESLIGVTDTFLFDLKDTNEERHIKHTGVSNERILKNLFELDRLGAKIRLRCILVNTVNTDASHYAAIADIATSLSNLDRVEIIPYHAYGGSKATLIGLSDNGRREQIPNEQQISEFKSYLAKNSIIAV